MKSVRKLLIESILLVYVFLQVSTNILAISKVDALVNKILILMLILIAIILIFSIPELIKNELSVLYLFIAIGLTFAATRNNFSNIIYLFWMPLLCLPLGLQQTIKIDLLARCVAVFGAVFLSLTSIIETGEFYTSSGAVRNSLGFSNPNGASEMLLIIMLESFIIYKNRISKLNVIMFLTTLIINVLLLKSRTTLLLYLLFVGMIIVVNKRKDANGKTDSLKFILGLVPIILMGAAYLSAKLFIMHPSNEWIQNINLLTSGRLRYAAYYLNQFGIHTFGNEIITQYQFGTSVVNYGSLDNGYLSLLLKFGYVTAIAFIFGYTILIRKIVSYDFLYLLPYVLIWLVLGLSETTFYYGSYNITGYFFVILIFNTTKGKINGIR